jgi:hypothetical protein
MRVVLILLTATALAVGGWLGYRATQPHKHCYPSRSIYGQPACYSD